jgi:tetratricopeptide (TPR) repeat protein
LELNLEILSQEILNKNISIFCGAGISFNSGVPLVRDIKSKILSSLPFEESDFDFLMKYSMPFELFMESLIESSSTASLLNIFEIGFYNTNHLFIARLAKEGYLRNIITTNFDNFIEKALEELKVSFKIYYKESDFEKIDWTSSEVKLIKIHGSIVDKSNMAVTIKKVANKEIMYKRNKVILEFLDATKGGINLFLGYSCSDIFDINPTISNSQHKNCKIWHFQHETTSQDSLTYTEIKNKLAPNPFSDYDGYLIKGNTDHFVKSLWRLVLPSQYTHIIWHNVNWSKLIDNWINEAKNVNGEAIKYFIAGQLLITTSFFPKALYYFFKGFRLSEASNNFILSIDFLRSIGRTYQGMQKFNNSLQNSLRYLHLGLRKSRKHKLKREECSILLSLGIVYEDKHNHELAIKSYEDALRIAEKCNDKILFSKCIGNLGIVFKSLADIKTNNKRYLLKKALLFQNISLQISINEGDKRSEGRTKGNIAVIYYKQDNIPNAIDYSKEALQIAIELSDLYHQGIWKHNIGDYYIGIDNIKSENYLLEAKKIFKTEGLDSFLKICNETIERLNRIKITEANSV